MQAAVGPAPLLGHPSATKQEPINFSRFQDVISQVGSQSYIFPCHYKGYVVLSHEQIWEGIDISGTIKHFSQNKFQNDRIFCRSRNDEFFVVGLTLFQC